jgi:hypothetical protein
VLAWYEAGYPPENNTASRVRGTRLSATGAPESGWQLDGNLLLIQGNLGWGVTTDDLGGLFVFGRRYVNSNLRIFLLRYREDGSRADGWLPLGNIVADSGGEQDRPVVRADGAGGAYVLWHDSGMHLQHVLGTGGHAPDWPVAGILAGPASLNDGALAQDGAGGVYAAFTRDAASSDLFLERFGVDSQMSAGWPASGFQVTFDGAFKPSILLTEDGFGGVTLAWATLSELRVQRRLSNGTYPAGWPSGGLLVDTGLDDLAFPFAAPDSTGGILLSWSEPSGGADRDSRLQRIQLDGRAGSTIDVPAPSARGVLLRAAPNPGLGPMHLAFELPASSGVTLQVFDLAGREVWARSERQLGPGPQEWTWDGRNGRGAATPKGVYFARLRTRWGSSRYALVRT